MKHKEGHFVNILSRSNAIFNENNEPIRMIGTHVDISPIKAIQHKLEYQKKLTQQYVDVAGTIMLALDPEQSVVLINPKGCEVLEYEKEEIIGKNWFNHFLPQENIEDVKKVFNQVITGILEQVEYFENAILTKNGEEKIIAWHNSVVKDENGEIIRLFSSGNDITEEAKYKKALEQSEETIRLALASGNQGLYDLNIKTGETKTNDNYALMLGYNPESFVETNSFWASRLHPDDIEKTTQIYNQYIKGGIPEYSVEFRQKTADNKWKWILSYGRIVEFDEEGKPLRMIGTHTNIDELKKAQEQLSDSEEKYKALYMNAPLAYQSLNITGRIIDVNPQWLKTLGYERKEVMGKYFGDFLNPESKEHFKEKFPVFKARGQVSDVRYNMITKTGDQIIVSFEGCIGYTKTGQFRQTYCTFKDITSETIANELLQEAAQEIEISERKFRELYEKSGDAIAILTHDQIIDCNQSYFKLFGYQKKEDIIGKNPGKLSPEYQPNGDLSLEAVRRYNNNLKELGTSRFEWYHMRKDKSLFPAEVLLTHLGENEHGVIQIHAVVRDITSRKQREKEIIEARNKAEESDRLKSAFLANMSHEIRTPMNGIMGFAELLKEPQLEKEEMQQYIAVIERSGIRMLNIINDLIDISKIEAQQMEVVLGDTNINKQINYLHKFFMPEAKKNNIALKTQTPLSDKDAVFHTDKEKLYAILTNLIKNAIKHTTEGQIEFGYKVVGKKLEFFVADSGTGIPQERQKHIFERFVQADMSHNRKFEGAGLGLAISKAYVEMLGGKIWIEKSDEEGTEFRFTIPK
jgi:PAS domain S-box-containing protein